MHSLLRVFRRHNPSEEDVVLETSHLGACDENAASGCATLADELQRDVVDDGQVPRCFRSSFPCHTRFSTRNSCGPTSPIAPVLLQ